MRKSIQQTTGREPTDIAAICCDERGDLVLFIGLPGPSTETFTYKAEPKGMIHLSKDAVDLYHRLENALEAAVKRGTAAQEDDSKGYALVNDPAARSFQLAMHDYALKHESELLRVLRGSSDAGQRKIAAEAVGYTRQSPGQMEALIRASRDPDDSVRNNATRALGVLVSSNPGLAHYSVSIPVRADATGAASGLKAGDVLTELDGAPVSQLVEKWKCSKRQYAGFLHNDANEERISGGSGCIRGRATSHVRAWVLHRLDVAFDDP